jgi:hypothetical protein
MITIWSREHQGGFTDDKEIVYEKIFLGKCHGVILTHRGKSDPHVCVQIITEDDDNWFISDNSFSSFWLPDLMSILEEAFDWIDKNCDDGDCGWKFR